MPEKDKRDKPPTSPIQGGRTVEIRQPEKDEYKVLLEWRAPLRIFKPRDKKFFRTILTIALVLVLILLFLREFIFIGAILAIIFIIYVLSTVPPEEVKHKVTTQGLSFAGHDYNWLEIRDFSFSRKGDADILNIILYTGISRKLPFILSEKVKKEDVRRILSKKIKFMENPREDLLDQLSAKVAKKFSLD